MKKLYSLIIFLSLPILCQGETSPRRLASHSQIEGICYLELTSNGLVTRRDQVILDAIDPWNNFGLTQIGNIQSFEVQVMLNVFNYDEIGLIETDEVRIVITNEKASAHSISSGLRFTQGEKLRVGLQLKEANLNCIVKIKKSHTNRLI